MFGTEHGDGRRRNSFTEMFSRLSRSFAAASASASRSFGSAAASASPFSRSGGGSSRVGASAVSSGGESRSASGVATTSVRSHSVSGASVSSCVNKSESTCAGKGVSASRGDSVSQSKSRDLGSNENESKREKLSGEPRRNERNKRRAAAIRAEKLKLMGNALFKKGKHQAAVEQYTYAITEFPREAVDGLDHADDISFLNEGVDASKLSVYYSNRAMCNLNLRRFEKVLSDSVVALQLDKHNPKVCLISS